MDITLNEQELNTIAEKIINKINAYKNDIHVISFNPHTFYASEHLLCIVTYKIEDSEKLITIKINFFIDPFQTNRIVVPITESVVGDSYVNIENKCNDLILKHFSNLSEQLYRIKFI